MPDTQEVLLSPDSDVTLIVEVLQRVDKDDLGEAVRCGNLLSCCVLERIIANAMNTAL